MKIVFVNKPIQDSNTASEDIQIIDGEIKHWCVRSEKMRENSFLEWLHVLENKIKENSKYTNVLGIYLYDFIHLNTPPQDGFCPLPGIAIRYDFIKKI